MDFWHAVAANTVSHQLGVALEHDRHIYATESEGVVHVSWEVGQVLRELDSREGY